MAGFLLPCTCLMRLKYGPDEMEQIHRSKKIDKMIEKDKHTIRRQVKLLLLGAGESGKSTFLKQMRIIHGHTFDEETVKEYRNIIYQNIVKGMKVLVDARDKLNIPWEDSTNEQHSNLILNYENNMLLDTHLFLMFAPSINHLWMDKGIRTAFDRRREFQLGDSVRYFFDHIERIANQDFLPSNQDILHARKATKGITEFTVPINNIPFRFVDVGGQRSQRQKWFQCFDSVTSILFLVSTSEFDQVLLEDRRTNRLLESAAIFETIVNNRCFAEVSIILFLNKCDLLTEKVCSKSSTDISRYFTNFQGNPHHLPDVQAFIYNLFDQSRRDRKKKLFHHFTTAVDTENIKVVFNAVRDTILERNITQIMLQ